MPLYYPTHCSWPNDGFLWRCCLISIACPFHTEFPSNPLVTRMLCDTPHISIHIPRGDSAMNPAIRMPLTPSQPIVLVSCHSSQWQFALLELATSSRSFFLPLSSLILHQWFPNSTQGSRMSHKVLVGHHWHLVPSQCFQFKAWNCIVIWRKFWRLVYRTRKIGNQCSSSCPPSAASSGPVWCHQQKAISLKHSQGIHKTCRYTETSRNIKTLNLMWTLPVLQILLLFKFN